MKKFSFFNYAIIIKKAKKEIDPKDQYFVFVKKENPEKKYKIILFLGTIFKKEEKRKLFALISIKYTIAIWNMKAIPSIEMTEKTFELNKGTDNFVTPLIFKYQIKPNELYEQK